MKQIVWSDHAVLKLEILKQHGFEIDREFVNHAVMSPERVDHGYKGRLVAQSSLDEARVLRVVYEASSSEIVIVTFYPARRDRYA